MTSRAGGLIGISVLWIPLAFLFDGVTVLMLPLRLGGDATALGIVSFVGLGLAAALQPVAGWLSDRLRARVDRRVFLTLAAVPALAGLWLLAGPGAAVAAVAGYVLLQVAATAMQASQQTLIPEHVPEARRGRAAGLKTAFDIGGAFLAFLVLGALLAGGDLVPAAIAMTLLLAGALALVWVLVPRATVEVHPAVPAPSLPPGFLPLVAARFLFLFGTYAVGRFLLLLVADRLGIDPARAVGEAGGLLALFTLVTAVAAVPVGWLLDGRTGRGLMIAGALVSSAGILALAPALGLGGVLAGGLLMALGTATFMSANWAATTRIVAPATAGRLMGIANLGTGLAAAAAGLLGPIIDSAGFVPALLIAATVSAAAVVPLAGRWAGRRAPMEMPT